MSYCQAEGATLNIGQLVDTPYPGSVHVLFTDLATERKTTIDNAGTSPDVSIDTEDFTPLAGHVYQVEVVLNSETGAIIPVPFKPYAMNGNDMEVSEDAYLYATARFVKVNTLADEVASTTEQWLVLKP